MGGFLLRDLDVGIGDGLLHRRRQLRGTSLPAAFIAGNTKLLPRPQRPGGPRLLIGGNGQRRTLPLAARFADEWNGVYLSPARFAELNTRLTALLAEQRRAPNSVRRSLMQGLVWGRTEAELRDKLRGSEAGDLVSKGVVVGVGADIRTQLDELAAAGVQRIMLQWLDLDDLEGIEALARALL